LKNISRATLKGRAIPVTVLLILTILLSVGSGLYAGASFFAQQAPNVTVTATIFTTTTSWTTSTIWSTVTSVVYGVWTTVQYTTSTSTKTVTAGTSTNFGTTSTTGMSTWPAASGAIYFARYTATSSGLLSSISFYATGISGSVTGNVGIYADSSGSPGTFLAQGASTTLVNGVNTFSSLSAYTSIASGNSYWLAFRMTGGYFYYGGSGLRGWGSGLSTCCTMPTSIPVSGTAASTYAIYATMTT